MEAEVESFSDALRIEGAGLKLPVDNRIPLKDYYDLATALHRKASHHRKNKTVIELHVTLLRFSSLVLETIPHHRDYMAKHLKQRRNLTKKANSAKEELECLKLDIDCHVDKLNAGASPIYREIEDMISPIATDNHPLFKQAQTKIDETKLTASSTCLGKLEDGLHEAIPNRCNMDRHASNCCCHLPPSPLPYLNFEDSRLEKSDLYPEGILPVNNNAAYGGVMESNVVPLTEDDREAEPNWKEDQTVDQNFCIKVQCLTDDITSLTQEIFELIRNSQQSDKAAQEALREAKKSESLCKKETRRRRKKDELLMDLLHKLENARIQQDELQNELQNAHEEKLKLETAISNLEDELRASQYMVDLLLKERDDAKQEVKTLCLRLVPTGSEMAPSMLNFTSFELEQATFNFDNESKIGEGRYTTVYKGFIRHTSVAIKRFNFDGQTNFCQEIELLGRVRHPHFAGVIGCCKEASSLVYEYLHNGSLEDCLAIKGCSPLSWPDRVRIATEICSALIFLHSCTPIMIHGNLKPSNILLDSNFTSKLCDLRTSHVIDFTANNSSDYSEELLAYIDPSFFDNYELTASSDVYSFGIIILRLLTGLPASGVIKAVTKALYEGELRQVLDDTVAEWPFIQASQLAHLGLRCCESNPSDRPTLEGEVWKALEPLMKSSSLGSLLFSRLMQVDDAPSYFLCPILQDIMREPQVAADGFTYEAEAIQGWFESGHDTSPMTNLKLPNKELLPNRALRAVIQEWLQSRSRHPCTIYNQ